MAIKLRFLALGTNLAPDVLELLNHDLWVIENALNSVGATSPIETDPVPPPTILEHDDLLGLGDDDHLQYVLLAGRGPQQNILGVVQVNGSPVVTETATQQLSNKTLDNTNAITVKDQNFLIVDQADSSKIFDFQVSGVGAGNTRTATVPNYSGRLPLSSDTPGADEVLKFVSGQEEWGKIDKAFLSDRTRSVYIEIKRFTQGNGTPLSDVELGTWPDTIHAVEFLFNPGTAPQGGSDSFQIPHDYAGGSIEALVVWAPKSTGGSVDTNWVARAHLLRFNSGTTLYDAAGTTLSANVLADATTSAKTVYLSSIGSTTPSGLAAGEVLRIGFDRNSGSGSDDYDDSVYVFGVMIRYTADM